MIIKIGSKVTGVIAILLPKVKHYLSPIKRDKGKLRCGQELLYFLDKPGPKPRWVELRKKK